MNPYFTGIAHAFDPGLLFHFGFEETVVITQMMHWIKTNKQNGENLKEGKTWTCQTQKDILVQLPYLGDRFKITRIIKSLVKKGIIETRNFNRHKYDKTTWYAFSDEKIWIKENCNMYTKQDLGAE